MMALRKECQIAKQLRHKMENAKNKAQKQKFHEWLEHHKVNCDVCNGKK